MELRIFDLIGPRCIVGDDGQKIYDEIHGPLLQGENVTLDFEGVTQFASPFFNFAVGQLLKDIKQPEFSSLLKIENLNQTGTQVIKRVIENAEKFYDDPDYRATIEDILQQQAEESD